MHNVASRSATADIVASLKRYSLAGMLGWQDVRQRYRRSAVGPFWLTISMGVMIGSIGVVFGHIFKSPMSEFLPFLAAGMILWSLISSVISEGCTGFISAEGIIKQLPIPLNVHILRLLWRNLIIFAHNLVIFPLVLLAVGRPLNLIALISIPGLALITINLMWLALILAVICARYRDLPQIVASLLQVLYFLTPIMWLPHSLAPDMQAYLLDLNPLFHLFEIFRAPLLGQLPTAANWEVSIGLAFVGWAVALFVFGRYKSRIAYWV
ncbi:ABC transporter permease [Caballeronia sp. dw_276]|uniref:ABC transporter permease n=1 Tax=Caballeronia sp. dw_276 TaxID=2719795 RepID=UPI002106AAB0|nr:ABC transporter permease [Caballeronia sp. dw_276]